MFKKPWLFLFFFVISSMVTAFSYVYWMHPDWIRNKEIKSDYASTEADASCAECVGVVGDNPLMQFDHADQCKKDKRDYLTKLNEKIPSDWMHERSSSSAEFPRICMLYIMKAFLPGSETDKQKVFTKCDGKSLKPVSNQYKACVDEAQVNLIYNSYTDVMHCLGLPQKDYLPKIMNESGFHVNALNPNGDVGIGQFTTIALKEANKSFKYVQKEVSNSNKESCKRLAPIIKDLTPVTDFAFSKRCQLLAPPKNPFLNLFYTGIKIRQDLHDVDSSMENRKIYEEFEKAGLKRSEINEDRLEEMVATLAYNAGTSGSVTLLAQYLKEKNANKKKVTLKDFDFSQDLSEFNAKLKENRLPFMEDHPDLPGKKRLIPAKAADWEAKKKKLYQAKDMTFPEFLRIYQKIGASGYLSFLYDNVRTLNRDFKEGTCAPESYLSL